MLISNKQLDAIIISQPQFQSVQGKFSLDKFNDGKYTTILSVSPIRRVWNKNKKQLYVDKFSSWSMSDASVIWNGDIFCHKSWWDLYEVASIVIQWRPPHFTTNLWSLISQITNLWSSSISAAQISLINHHSFIHSLFSEHGWWKTEES